MGDQEPIWNQEYQKHRNKWHKETKLPKTFKNLNVLELGAGNGKTLISILKQKPKSLTAIDFSRESIHQLKSKKELSDTNIIQANIQNLPFQDNCFDIVVCYYILNNLLESERVKAVIEMRRVLKPKGVLLFEDFSKGDFRQKGKSIEENTIQKSNGLICHFFTKSELTNLFNSFSKKQFIIKKSNPIAYKSKLKRIIISGNLIK